MDEYTVNFKAALKAKRRNQKTNRIKTVFPKWLYPRSTEIKYYQMLRSLVRKPIKEKADFIITHNIERWIKEKERMDMKSVFYLTIDNENIDKYNTYTMSIHSIANNDEWYDEIYNMNNELSMINNNIIGNVQSPQLSELWHNLSIIADTVFMFNEKQWEKQTIAVLGYPYKTNDLWWKDLKYAWILENFNIIKNMSQEYINRISETINRTIRNGLSIEEIIKEINKIDRMVFKNRASLIAVDQIGKLNAQITKRRHLQIGIKYYVWETQRDERVRGNPKGRYPKAFPSHWVMQSTICSWLDDNVFAEMKDIDMETGKIKWQQRLTEMPRAIPGEEFRCRCIGRPFWLGLFLEVDKEIDKEKEGLKII